MNEQLLNQPGWKLLVEHLNKVKSMLLNALTEERDHTKLMLIQSKYKAFDSIITTVSSAKMIKEKLFKDVQDIMEDEKMKEQFDI